jgi:hypothetical protein
MIFPDMPKRRYVWTQQPADQIYHESRSMMDKVQPVPVTENKPVQISADEWYALHFPDQLHSTPIHREPFDWRKDPVGIAKLCGFAVFMITWTWYWHQFQ